MRKPMPWQVRPMRRTKRRVVGEVDGEAVVEELMLEPGRLLER